MRSIVDIIAGKRDEAAEAAVVSTGSPRAQSIYRLQVGLSGLAAIVLVVALANVIMDRAHRTEAASVPEAAATVAPSPSPTPKNDPLAEVGVVPNLPDDPTPSATPTRAPTAASEQADDPATQ